jgi:hypothetical protein
MTPQAFIAKWRDNALTEKAGAQAHFEDLCALLEVEPPRIEGEYQYERGLIKKSSASQGWADVWKRGCFAWEYKAPGKDLGAALKQLMTYALALDNPPLLVVSDRNRIEIHTHFTGTPSEVHTITLEDMGQPQNLQKLRWLFDAPENFKPKLTTYAVTEAAAERMGTLAKRLTERGDSPLQVAHFLIQCVFCMFAEDAKLLPQKLFETVLDKSNPDGVKAQDRLTQLFKAMQKGGDFALETIPWFNGGLFEQIGVPQLTTEDVVQLLDAARMDWGAIEPAILGTLFERGLNPDMRSQLGAHYTDPATILKLIHPTIVKPLENEWKALHAKLVSLAPQFGLQKGKGKGKYVPNVERRQGQAVFNTFLERLKNYRVLDPACGSGNFLYLALKSLKDIEHRVNLEAEALGLQREVAIETSLANVLGIELNPYAAELARVTVWIGEIQWMLAHGYPIKDKPILQPLDHIECRDAVLNFSPSPSRRGARGEGEKSETAVEPEWPAVDAIVGNPPFLGGSKKRGELGDAYFNALNNVYADRVPGGADLVTYWFEKARAQIEMGKAQRAGLVATQAIRSGSNRKVLERILNITRIFEAWSDEPWINNGAAVRVSLVCFGRSTVGCAVRTLDGGAHGAPYLDGQLVAEIHADLTAGGGLDLTQAKSLEENAWTSFEGTKKYGDFDIVGEIARQWLKLPNPNGQPNAEVVKPWANGKDITARPSDTWIIDYGTDMTEADAALYETPFAHVLAYVKPYRETVNRERTRRNWWIHEEARVSMRKALKALPRFIVTPRVAKHRFFVWLSTAVLPDTRLNVIASDSETTFGILSSRIHEAWSLAQASMHGDGSEGGRPTYNAKSCFETFPFPFPFPEGLTPRDTASSLTPESRPLTPAHTIAAAAKKLNELREAWLNPPEWVDWVRTPEEEKASFPLRPVAKPGHEAELKKRTLTNLYNARPAWLDNVHKELDAAVAAAYGWADYMPDMPDEEILRRLLALNQERAE